MHVMESGTIAKCGVVVEWFGRDCPVTHDAACGLQNGCTPTVDGSVRAFRVAAIEINA